MPAKKPLLTKSHFTLYLQSPLELWLKVVRPDLLKPKTPENEMRFETGRIVDDLSRELYPGGIVVEGYNEQGAKNTQTALAGGAKILYQPTAVTEGISARADLLVKAHGEAWDIHEVKSTTSTKDEHVFDLAFQRICFEAAGFKIGKLFLTHLNNEYVRHGKIDVAKLFAEDEVTEDVNAVLEQVRELIPQAQAVLSWPKELAEAELVQCKDIDTDYGNVLHWLNHQEPGERERVLKGMNPFKLSGLLEKQDVSPDGLSKTFLSSVGYKPPEKRWPLTINEAKIKQELDALVYPLYFYDYETFASAVPAFDGYRPYQAIPFQFSLAVQDTPGAKPRIFDFLMETFEDPVPSLIEALRANIGPKGTVISWHMGFENTRNKEMAVMHPEHADFLLDINERTFDLMQIFKKKLYVHPDFYGSASLKNVMPALIPDLSYKNLNIQEGGEASASWKPMTDPARPKAERDRIRKDEIAYCRLDVMAMVRILQLLQQL
ncbi:MAG: DUF2779 domain-containing protein [Patescibacteria group bacterium]